MHEAAGLADQAGGRLVQPIEVEAGTPGADPTVPEGKMTAMRAYLGAATSGGGGNPAEGITILEIDGPTITPVGSGAHGVPNPMYLAFGPRPDVLYTVHEVTEGAVSAWRIDGSQLVEVGAAQSVGGTHPCHLGVHPSGSHVFVANYADGTVAVLPVLEDGSLGPATSVVQHEGTGPNTARQEGPHAHMVLADGEILLAVDLGTDAIYRYELDPDWGRLELLDVIDLPPGAGPRHLVVRGRTAFVANELDSTVSVVDLDAGTVTATSSTLAPGDEAQSMPSAIRLSADGRFLYVANRGPDTIAVLTADDNPTLIDTVPTGGVHPRDATLSPDGANLYVANQFSDTVAVFAVDTATGHLESAGTPFATPSPASIVFAP